jgi:hypothetical protein
LVPTDLEKLVTTGFSIETSTADEIGSHKYRRKKRVIVALHPYENIMFEKIGTKICAPKPKVKIRVARNTDLEPHDREPYPVGKTSLAILPKNKTKRIKVIEEMVGRRLVDSQVLEEISLV